MTNANKKRETYVKFNTVMMLNNGRVRSSRNIMVIQLTCTAGNTFDCKWNSGKQRFTGCRLCVRDIKSMK